MRNSRQKNENSATPEEKIAGKSLKEKINDICLRFKYKSNILDENINERTNQEFNNSNPFNKKKISHYKIISEKTEGHTKGAFCYVDDFKEFNGIWLVKEAPDREIVCEIIGNSIYKYLLKNKAPDLILLENDLPNSKTFSKKVIIGSKLFYPYIMLKEYIEKTKTGDGKEENNNLLYNEFYEIIAASLIGGDDDIHSKNILLVNNLNNFHFVKVDQGNSLQFYANTNSTHPMQLLKKAMIRFDYKPNWFLTNNFIKILTKSFNIAQQIELKQGIKLSIEELKKNFGTSLFNNSGFNLYDYQIENYTELEKHVLSCFENNLAKIKEVILVLKLEILIKEISINSSSQDSLKRIQALESLATLLSEYPNVIDAKLIWFSDEKNEIIDPPLASKISVTRYSFYPTFGHQINKMTLAEYVAKYYPHSKNEITCIINNAQTLNKNQNNQTNTILPKVMKRISLNEQIDGSSLRSTEDKRRESKFTKHLSISPYSKNKK
ncbi:MAG: hypothetical protein J0H68_04735 [Sphingobacteriia bacterium]|nr:hypothetical protein [Sphingobacteriia bacterium]